jgi:hypothetical protein
MNKFSLILSELPKIPFFGSPLLAFLLFIFLFFSLSWSLRPEEKNPPGEKVATVEAQKIEPSQEHPKYPTDPPTSGWYVDYEGRSGVFDAPFPDEKIVGALKDGYVFIFYNCTNSGGLQKPLAPVQSSIGIDDKEEKEAEKTATAKTKKGAPEEKKQTKEEMLQVYAQVRNQNKRCAEIISFVRNVLDEKGVEKIIMMPRSSLKSRVVMASWGVLDEMDLLDRSRLVEFIDYYRK